MKIQSNQRIALAACSVLALIAAGTVAKADDWTQWRGPKRDGVSLEKGLLKAWPKEGPKLAWQVKDIGSVYSTPVVVGSRLYVLSNEGLENEFVRAYSTINGKQLWSTRLGSVGNPKQQVKGLAKEIAGKTQRSVGDAKEIIKDASKKP